MKKEYYIGLMSGTSLDGIDAALVELDDKHCKLIKTHHKPFSAELRRDILSLCTPGYNGIARMGHMDVMLGREFAGCVKQLLEQSHMKAQQITAIGSHGQTIRHIPVGEHPFSFQIGDPNVIAAETGITTVADFRRRDMALGGQGAPLAPAFHAFMLQNIPGPHWVLNLGGIANLTYINKDRSVLGFDTGPGNTLMDAWCQRCLDRPFDDNGNWAHLGTIQIELLDRLLADDYFHQAPPKSTGREYFNLQWVKQHVNGKVQPEDLQATLVELTAVSIARAIEKIDVNAKHLWLCGGGAKNRYLISRIQARCPQQKLLTTQAIGVPSDWIEACLMAWLARQTLRQRPGNITEVTGARESAILGAIYAQFNKPYVY